MTSDQQVGRRSLSATFSQCWHMSSRSRALRSGKQAAEQGSSRGAQGRRRGTCATG